MKLEISISTKILSLTQNPIQKLQQIHDVMKKSKNEWESHIQISAVHVFQLQSKTSIQFEV